MTREQDLFQRAVLEIQQLRKRNYYLETRLSGFEDALLLLKTSPFGQSQGMGEDIVWQIEKHLEKEKTDIPEDEFLD